MTCKIIFLYNFDENLMQYLEGLPSFAEHPHPPGPERNPGCASFDPLRAVGARGVFGSLVVVPLL